MGLPTPTSELLEQSPRYSLMVCVANDTIKCLLSQGDLVIPEDIPLTIVDKVTEFIEQAEGQRETAS